MKSVIALMSEIEKEACEIVDNATEKKVKMYEEFDNKVVEIDEKYKNMLGDEIEKINNKCKHVYDKEINTVRLDTEKGIEKLDSIYKTKHDKYIDDLFNRIIGM